MEPKVQEAIKSAKRAATAKTAARRLQTLKPKAIPHQADAKDSKLALIIRIRGTGGIRHDFARVLDQIHLTRRYHACLLERVEAAKLLQNVKDYVAWGEPDEQTVAKLIEARLSMGGSKPKPDAAFFKKMGVAGAPELASALVSGKIKPFAISKIGGARPFFALHPPVKGLRGIKGHYPTQSLGYWGKEIGTLAQRML